ncbi:MAG: membrane protease YdiL (CAAX protease family) [Planctomycetota bacterium]|jgi:membrane protease YdiL (CAAX protease family)
METRIGADWQGSRAKIAALFGIAAVVFDLTQRGAWAFSVPRLGLGLALLVFFSTLTKGGRNSVGLTRQVQPSVSFWPKWTLILGGLVLAGSLIVGAVLWMLGDSPSLQSQFASQDQMLRNLWQACLWAPIEEELLYRVALCAPLAALVGTRWTVLIGGLTFAALHWSYGNLGPNHVFAGFVMTWAYLRSGNIGVPILLHSLGNLAVWLLNVALFYWAQA